MFKLVIQDDEGKTTVVPLIRDEITIGRKEGNTIRLTERNVSRRHARIARSNGEVTIEDLGSYNGIRVNNARIAERIALRLSDQVQIGDYKLYLKSEAVEAVDDGKTMPHERVDGNATAVMSAMAGEPTEEFKAVPTEQMPAPANALPTQPPGGGNVSMAAIADTDPVGRPVASAAAVAAMNAPASHGRLVVLSTNFAGEEFELSRPQMFIGRTSDNDIVLDHRSISRNHAKVVRAENGRYTITDSQSSNGLRVNGQDFSKHELKRGDTVDLGHVRLRYVEAGEDFVLGRDAQIADVPEGGSKKTMWIVAGAAALLLGGVGIVMAMKGGGKNEKENVAIKDGGIDAAATAPVKTPDAAVAAVGSDNVVAVGSDGSGSDAIGSAGSGTPMVGSNQDTADKMASFTKTFTKCEDLRKASKWADAAACAEPLAALEVPQAKEVPAFVTQMRSEAKNETLYAEFTAASSKQDFKTMAAKVAEITNGSSFKAKASEANDKARTAYIAQKSAEAARAFDNKQCSKLTDLKREAAKAFPEAAAAVEKQDRGCVETVAVNPNKDPNNPNHTVKPNPNPNTTTNPNPTPDPIKDPVPPKQNCDLEALRKLGTDNYSANQFGVALKAFKDAIKCGDSSARTIQLAGMSACRRGQIDEARLYYNKASSATARQAIGQACDGKLNTP